MGLRALPRRIDEHLRSLHAVHADEALAPLSVRRFGVLVVAAAALVVGFYHGQAWAFRDRLAPRWIEQGLLAIVPAELEIWSLGYQGLAQLVIYGVVPLALAWGLLRVPAAELGLVPQRRTVRALLLALGAFVVSLPVLYLMSLSPAVQQLWPAYRAPLFDATAPQLAVWHALLLAQVAGQELLLRGLLVCGLYPVLGAASVVVAAVPFAMLGFGTLSMALLAFAGGLVLGWLALVGRSVYPALALHWAAAVALELMSAAQQQG